MSWLFIWFSSVMLFLAAMTDAEPSCDNVENFWKCTGNSDFFCPSGIQCICKDQKPYCDCPNFRGPRGDYWYMGAKCDQMWNTLDLILVTVLPAVALAVAVAVTAQLIHFCNTTKKENAPKSKPRQAERLTVHSHQNHGYEPYIINNQRYTEISQDHYNTQNPYHDQRMSGRAREDQCPGEKRLQYPANSHKVLQQSHISNTPYHQSDRRLGNTGISLPEQDYDIDEVHGPQSSNYVHKVGVPVLPRNSAGSSHTDQQFRMPYVIGRPQIKNDYRY